MESEEKKALYDRFQDKLMQELLKLCTSLGDLDGTLLSSLDIDDKWDDIAADYIADGVKEFNQYPEVAIAWPGYLGMAVARRWDTDWGKYSKDVYKDFLGKRGFDDMDEHITRDILKHPLNSKEAGHISDLLSSCAQCTLSLIRHEGIESATADAYYIYVRVCGVMFRIGAAVELKSLGYKMTPII